MRGSYFILSFTWTKHRYESLTTAVITLSIKMTTKILSTIKLIDSQRSRLDR